MRVQEAMTVEVTTTTPETSLKDAALELASKGISGMPVVDAEGRVIGVLSETDILAKEGVTSGRGGLLGSILEHRDSWSKARFDAVTVGEAMSSPAKTTYPQANLAHAAATMLAEKVNRLPVVDTDGTLLGLLSRSDLVRAFARTDAEIQHEIEEDVLRRVMWLNPSDVSVSVANGVVTLDGSVTMTADAELLPAFTRRVPGVVAVESSVTSRE